MADHYVEYIADGLKLHPELSSQAFINYWEGDGFYLNSGDEWIDWDWDDFFTALAWEGLMSSTKNDEYKISAWENLSQHQKDLIEDYQNNNYESNKCN